MTKTLSSASSNNSASLLNQVTYGLSFLSSYCLTFKRIAEDLLYHWPPTKCVTKSPLSSLKVEMELGAILLNHTQASPLSVIGKALHMISSGTPCRCIKVLNDSRWSFNLSYDSTYDILNLVGREKEVTGAVQGESVRWTSSSRLVDTRPLMALIIISISLSLPASLTPCATRRLPVRRDDLYPIGPAN